MKNFIRWLLEPFYYKTLLPFLGAAGFILYGGGKGGDSDPPDYTALAKASEEAAKLGKELGDSQLAENKRQYDQNYAVQKPITEAQTALMGQTKAQGDDYFSYMKQFSRPVEKQLFYESMGFTPEEVGQIEASRATETSAAKQQLAAQAAATPKTGSFTVPTYLNELPAGTVKGSALPKGASINTGLSVKDNTGYWGFGQSNYVDSAVTGTVDPNASYVPVTSKDRFGRTVTTYKLATPVIKEGTKEVTYQLPADTPDYSNIETPQTDALTAQLGLTAKARMDAADKTERDAILAKNNELESRIGETDTQVYNRYKDDIEAEAGQAVADSRAGYTNAINTAARQGLRYGFSPAKLAAAAGSQSVQQAGMQAGAANQTRKAAVTTMYSRGATAANTALSGLNNNRNLRIQDAAIATAKKQDVAGLYRGLPGASQGSYGLAVSAGNSAVQNQNSTSAQYMNGITQGNNTIQQGQAQKITGLGQIASSQTSAYNASMANGGGDAIWGALGTVGGAIVGGPAGAAIGAKITSDETVKKDIKPVSDKAALDGITKTPITRWKYDPEKVQDAELVDDDQEHVGAMAQDVQKNLGSNVSDGKTIDVISALGITMSGIKALAKKVEKLEGKKK